MQELVTSPEANPFGSPVAILSDHFCPWTQAVATKLGIPRYVDVLYTSPAKLLALLFYFPSFVAADPLPLQCNLNKLEDSDDAMNGSVLVPELGPIPLHELPKSLIYTSSSTSYELVHQFFHHIACLLHQSSGVIVNSFHDLESRALDALNHKTLNPNRVPIFSIGPILPYPISTDHNLQTVVSHDSTPPVTGWLNTQSPSSVLYISFGSVYVPSLAQMYEIAVGLKSSQLPFFWVLKFPSISESANPSAIFSFLPEGFEQHTQKHGRIVTSWVPQPLILSHTSIGGFLTHCGWNSTIESIYSGVPMIAFPQMAEQQLICGMVVDEWKVGIRLQRENDGLALGAELERAAKRLLARSEETAIIRKRMLEMKAAARRAVTDEDGSSSSSNLHFFIKEIIAKSNIGSLASNVIKN